MVHSSPVHAAVSAVDPMEASTILIVIQSVFLRVDYCAVVTVCIGPETVFLSAHHVEKQQQQS